MKTITSALALTTVLFLSGADSSQAAQLSEWEKIWVRQCLLDGHGQQCDRQIDAWRRSGKQTLPHSWIVRDRICSGRRNFTNEQVRMVFESLEPHKETLTRDWLLIRDEQIDAQMRDYGLTREYAEQRVDSIYLIFLLGPFCDLQERAL